MISTREGKKLAEKSALSKSSLSQQSSLMPPSTSSLLESEAENDLAKANGNGNGLTHANINSSTNNPKSYPMASDKPSAKENCSGPNLQIKPLSISDRKSARKKALEEAEAVLTSETIRTNRRLENFNLLGVVTSPRILEEISASAAGSGLALTSVSSAGMQQSDANASSNYSSGVTNAKKYENVQPTADASAFASAAFFNSMSTSISKEIESLNTTLYSYSKSYLGNYGGYGEAPSLDFQTELGYDSARIPKGQIAVEDLPKELLEIDLSSVEAYLRKCGAIAEQLNLRDIQNGDDEDNPMDVDVSGRITVDLDGEIGLDLKNESQLMDEANPKEDQEDPTASVPEVFFNQHFDLTDPKTFESLLVVGDDEIDESEYVVYGGAEDGNGGMDTQRCNNDPIIRIQRPEKLTQHLDTIELALLNQVRSKSSSFFRETNRFSYLKSLVAESVQEVQSLRSQLDAIRERSITDAEMIPLMDRRRYDTKLLGQILDEIVNVVEVKSSVGGLIASGNYLEAVEAIHMARRLLNGGSISDDDSESKDAGQKQRHVLRKITALNKINDQLTQYEDLVVMDLSNELVESFLSWNGRGNGEMLGSNNLNGFGNTQGTKVKQTILAMKKCGKLSTMADIYREKLCDTIRVTIRTTVTECAADAAKDASLIPAASATIVQIPDKSSAGKESKDDSGTSKSSIIEGVVSMSFDQFMECLDMIYEHTITLLKSAAGVNKFCLEEGISFKDDESLESEAVVESNKSTNPSALAAGADLSHRSISEILRLRKETHSLITFDEMRRLWDSCIAFTLQLERISGQKAYVLRSTLLSQAKAFVERKHEANMSSLAAALDSERWTQCDISAERQAILDRLCSGRAVLSARENVSMGDDLSEKQPIATVEGKKYRVVWSCLLLIEMIMSNVACAAHFQTLATNAVGKVSDLLRLFNSRATQLVLGAGAIHSSARLKSINAKHLALVTQCVGIVQSILPHVRAALMAQLPSRQEPLLADLDKIKKEYAEHHDKVLSKFVSIIGGIVEHSLISRIRNTNFVERSKLPNGDEIECCPFLDGVITSTRKMHYVLVSLLPLEDLIDVFSRIFAHLDSSIPKIFLAQDLNADAQFSLPESLDGKRRLLDEVQTMANKLNGLPDVRPWDFGAVKFLSRRLEVSDDNEVEIKCSGEKDTSQFQGQSDLPESDFDCAAESRDQHLVDPVTLESDGTESLQIHLHDNNQFEETNETISSEQDLKCNEDLSPGKNQSSESSQDQREPITRGSNEYDSSAEISDAELKDADTGLKSTQKKMCFDANQQEASEHND